MNPDIKPSPLSLFEFAEKFLGPLSWIRLPDGSFQFTDAQIRDLAYLNRMNSNFAQTLVTLLLNPETQTPQNSMTGSEITLNQDGSLTINLRKHTIIVSPYGQVISFEPKTTE